MSSEAYRALPRRTGRPLVVARAENCRMMPASSPSAQQGHQGPNGRGVEIGPMDLLVYALHLNVLDDFNISNNEFKFCHRLIFHGWRQNDVINWSQCIS